LFKKSNIGVAWLLGHDVDTMDDHFHPETYFALDLGVAIVVDQQLQPLQFMCSHSRKVSFAELNQDALVQQLIDLQS
jgi:hypothetical protein